MWPITWPSAVQKPDAVTVCNKGEGCAKMTTVQDCPGEGRCDRGLDGRNSVRGPRNGGASFLLVQKTPDGFLDLLWPLVNRFLLQILGLRE
jgi:hypothetical protein